MIKSLADTGQRNNQVPNQAALALALALVGILSVVPTVSYFPGYQSNVVEVLRAGQPARQRADYFDQTPRVLYADGPCNLIRRQCTAATEITAQTADRHHRRFTRR